MKNRVICNPLNLDYKYQEMATKGLQASIYREAADPTVVLCGDKYYLFPSVSGGFWWSDDLIDWNFVERSELPIYDYAPDVRMIGDYMYFCASRKETNCYLYRTKDPINEPFEDVAELFPFWDPNLFCDDDGKIYLYWGCSNKEPIYGVELDKITFQPLTEPLSLFNSDVENHGWERGGVNNDPNWFEDEYAKGVAQFVGTRPYMEGPYMTKMNGTYYLQYGAPATERNTYADGVYVSDSPLGPFTYCVHNPFSLKPGGFITGAGHGSTFEDKFGNWWHIATMRIGINHPMERRIGLFPAGFDKDGLLYCNQNYADYPIRIPNKKVSPNEIIPEQMLLSYNKSVIASSQAERHPAKNITNENIRDIWVAKSSNAGEYVMLDLEKIARIGFIQLNFADYKIEFSQREDSCFYEKGHSKRYINMKYGNIRYLLEGSKDRDEWFALKDKRDTYESLQHELLAFDEEIECRYIRITMFEQPYHQNFAISDIRVFGISDETLPLKTELEMKRNSKTSVTLAWEKQKGAVGYNIRYGISKEKLYTSWQVYDESELTINGLNAESHYYFAVDCFNGAGVTEGIAQYLD